MIASSIYITDFLIFLTYVNCLDIIITHIHTLGMHDHCIMHAWIELQVAECQVLIVKDDNVHSPVKEQVLYLYQ